MRADRFRSLQQRLRREADAFEFGALIDGVSTIEPEARSAQPIPPAEAVAADIPPLPEQAPEPTEAAPAAEPTDAQPPSASVSVVAKSRKARAAAPTPPANPEPSAPPAEDRVRVALQALESRLLQASSRFRAAVAVGQAEEAGLRLADINQILELLGSIDPTGDASRKLGTSCAPPKGKVWPRPVWTVAEFAESPLSGMLPPSATEAFVRSVFYSAWGVTFE